MILHSPEDKEMLEDFDIPVIIEYSSYEPHHLGRVEWIKFFGALTGMEEEAEKAFEKQTEIVKHVTATKKTDKTVAVFYITSNGLGQVRQSNDYIPKMIELAGGRYIFENLGDDSKRSTMNMQVEEFYNKAKDADYLIYNSTIDGGVKSVDEHSVEMTCAEPTNMDFLFFIKFRDIYILPKHLLGETQKADIRKRKTFRRRTAHRKTHFCNFVKN